MAIGFSGIGAGADWNGIINQLLQIESRPLTQLQTREKVIEKQISDYGLVKSAVDTFKSSVEDLTNDTGFAAFSTTSSDEAVLTVAADSSAVASSYDVVVTQLASRDKLASSAYTDSATATGTGSLSITVDGTTMNLAVDATNNTLAGLRNAINDASDNPGVTATILNEASGSRLILTSAETGLANAISVSVVDADDGSNTDANGLSRLFHVGVGNDGLAEQVDTAQDALLTIDGFSIVSSSNAVTGAVSGVTLELVAAGAASIGISRDNSKIEEKINQFVDAYNTILSELDDFETGSLGRDSSLRRIKQGFVNVINQAANIGGSDAYLFEIGITRDKLGVISVDSGELADALANDFDRVSQILSDATTGYATRFFTYADQLLDLGGIIDSKNEGLSSQKRSLQNQIERQELHLETYEKILINQFASLDRTMSILQGTSNYLTGQLASLQSG
ncbi:MAG: flagellar filament capping protein FliD [Candidatus Thiodiazotropha sp. (ex Lucinoma borealis)]|nr:flagellar filament capping protein FliD [Candidatus Thiodiazotropha sp. (ex Lucinoma borealis)]MCU7855705.1 flagellar filament capping protein FliD [Candidatus Thiodiazotropha sp. (ex Lucinoma borealis)]MCU7863069.1 flagellar filament capping protein FliD [Candidatus Thiodiazotropha sp. (ex Lucinoma borealis)]MCU7867288.1 flagellar filament capping protein FliD [Candidatus Thiodiazotropha sp. (ex Lucinoma borealis)]